MEVQKGRFPTAIWKTSAAEREVTVWCSNDYLGLSHSPRLKDAVSAAIDAHGTGAGGTRNIAGTHPAHVALEAQLAEWHDKKAHYSFLRGG